MLPHIVHSIPRAAAVVQNQTHTLRNVLQLQSTNPSSGSGSGWGNGPGPGGPKYGTGSRFYSGLNSAGRAVAQANAVTSHDTSAIQDDVEEVTPRRSILPTPQKRTRMRSSSVSLSVAGRRERGEKMGVLKTVQLHARSKHVFAPADTLASAKEHLSSLTTLEDNQARPLLVRRNSTSAPLSPLLTPSDPSGLPTPPPERTLSRRNSTSSVRPSSPAAKVQELAPTEPSAPQTVTPPPTPRTAAVDTWVDRFQSFRTPRDAEKAADAVRAFAAAVSQPTIEQYNAALNALTRVREDGEPLTMIIRLYNSILEKSIAPSVETYEILIRALTQRDVEIHKAIQALTYRKKHLYLDSRAQSEIADSSSEEARVELLKSEDNFSTAMSLFESVLAVKGADQLQITTYIRLLKSCSLNANVTAAIHVFAQLESKGVPLDYNVYKFMIQTFTNAKRFSDAEAIFESYLQSAKTGRVKRFPSHLVHIRRTVQIQIWNAMIESYFQAGLPDKAIDLVDQMMQSSGGDHFLPHDVPIPTSSTFSTVIAGFLASGDIHSALAWFQNLCTQEQGPANPYEGLNGKAMQPDAVAWALMIDALAEHGRIEELNEIYKQFQAVCERDQIPFRKTEFLVYYYANMGVISTWDDKAAIPVLDTLGRGLTHMERWDLTFTRRQQMVLDLAKEYIARGRFSEGVELFSREIQGFITEVVERGEKFGGEQLFQHHRGVLSLCDALYGAVQNGRGTLPFSAALTLSRMVSILGIKPELRYAPFYLDAYGRTRADSLIAYEDLTINDWSVLLSYAVYHGTNAYLGNPDNLPVVPGFAFSGVPSLLEDMSSQNIDFGVFDPDVKKRTLDLLASSLDDASRNALFANLNASFTQAWKEYDQLRYEALQSQLTQLAEPPMQAETAQVLDTQYTNLVVSSQLSRAIEDQFRGHGFSTEHKLTEAYKLFEQGLAKGDVPQPSTIARLIQGVGRAGELDKVRNLYTVAQAVLPSFYQEHQLSAWVQIEDSMIIALAHSGHVDAAHAHRFRILDQGRAPSADAYGVLIQHVKDTTDDTSGGLVLFQEALERGVKPNLYLYNNIISKLSRARKADYALELFQQMKANRITPSSITYGAVIGACARVGDVQSAQSLFQEMVHLPNFKPRVPPYNTMMQLYTTTKPSRASAIYYYDQLIAAGIHPSAHTYKLLLDAYGSIEPVDLPAMERTFEMLKKDPQVHLNGAHFASLINAYGCVSKDLDKSISVFESMPTIPGAPAPDAVVFEAIINVIVAHKRTDLIPVYIAKMSESGVHMTAYIANFLIKGYANVGEMDRAREIFESLLDPPTGVAAPNNHAPHNPSSAVDVPVMEPVYREPSTWEAMVRAELGTGNRDAAIALLERLRARQYPEAVYNRISGVMTDHSIPQ
ncbi:hypothetical protein CVT24_003654 [Panaeolus cyanescens]|uniref:Pentacotripeptide-repeat region of PRORP domain-containing protein n=1 Tax=Panaeolus cyanescens TaxID=181874 RepID=A0A409WC21_9AGAR|nr:hypothetical protein CVT24_003654 [Panaeolus cyanescens]